MINALGSNQCLQVLDISGNGMGDVGARLLAKALQINTRLRQIMLDRNNITLQGNTKRSETQKLMYFFILCWRRYFIKFFVKVLVQSSK